MNIIGTGLSGLVGSRAVELLSHSYTFTNLSLETGIDITNFDVVKTALASSDAPWVFHFAAYTNVQGAEKDRDVAWKVNVDATENIVKVCRIFKKRVVYIDTDYAFDGKYKEGYSEDDKTSPLGWYAKTKSEGAKYVLAYDKGLVIRISNPYRANPVGKTDFVHKMLERLKNNQGIVAPSDQLFVPTFIDDIATAIEKLISVNASGIYHVVSGSPLSPYDAAIAIAIEYSLDPSQIQKTTFAEYFKDRAPTPQYAALSNDKIRNLGVSMHSFQDGLRLMHQQEG